MMLLDEVAALVVDNPLQVLKVDVPVDKDHHIVHLARIGQDDLADILAVAVHKCSPGLITGLIGHNFLIVAVLVKILDALAELIANVPAAAAQVQHLYRRDADAGLRQGWRYQASKPQQATAHIDILRMLGITHVVYDIISIMRKHATRRHQQQR